MHTDDDARRRDEHDVVVIGDELHIHERARLFVEHARLDALAAARLHAVIGGIGALAVAVLGDGENIVPLFENEHIDDGVALREVDGAHAHRIAPHRADVLFGEADTLAGTRGDDDLVRACRELYGDELVALGNFNGDLAAAHDAVELARGGLFDETVLGRHHKIPRAVFRNGQNGGDLLARVELDDIDDRPSARGAVRLGDLIPLDGVHLAEVGEEQDIVMRGAYEHLLDEVVLLRAMPRDAHAAAILRAVFGNGETLHIARMGHGNDDVLLVDEVLVLDLAVIDGDLRLSLGGIFRLDGKQIVLDDFEHAPFAPENVFEVSDRCAQPFQLLFELLHFEGSETLQAHFENRVRLPLGKLERGGQAFRRLVLIRRFLDDPDDLVDIGERKDKPFDDMRALLGAGKIELRAADDDFLLVVEIVHENLAQVEDFRLGAVLDERQKDNAVGSLQIGVLVEGVQDDLRVRVLLAFDDDAHTVAPRLLADIRNAFEAFIAYHVRDRLDELGFVDLIGNFGDDDAAS